MFLFLFSASDDTSLLDVESEGQGEESSGCLATESKTLLREKIFLKQ